jgi:DNA repair protein RadC
MADHEVLELLLFYAIPRRDTNELAHRLIQQFGSLRNVLSASVEELERVNGVGESAALLLHLLPEVYARALTGDEPEQILNSCERAGEYFLDLLGRERREVLYQVCLDAKGKVIACRRLSEGSIDQAVLDVRRVVEVALAGNASGVLLAHNHPSGVALPSPADRQITRRVQRALSLLGIELIDHIIVADGDFVSMAASGDLHLTTGEEPNA